MQTQDFLFISSSVLLKGGSGTSGSLKEGEFLQLISEPDRDENLASLCLGLNVDDEWDDGPWLPISIDGVAPEPDTLAYSHFQ